MGDVAKAAKVAPMTVSRALRTPDRVAPETRKRIERAIRSLNYVPNMAAGTLASRRSRIVAVIVPNISNSVFAVTLHGIADVLRAEHYHLLIGYSGYSLQGEEGLVRAFLGRRPDAIVLTGYSHTKATVAMVRTAGIPCIEMWNLTKTPIDTIVGFSNFEAARQMTLYLAKKGYRRIGYIGGPIVGNDRAQKRKAGFRAACAELGWQPKEDLMLSVPFNLQGSADALDVILRREPRTDAVFAAGDTLAVGVLLEAARRGLKVPEDFGVAGFDDAEISERIVPSLTTVRVPRYKIGVTVAEHLLGRIAGGRAQEKVIDLGFEIIERGSA